MVVIGAITEMLMKCHLKQIQIYAKFATRKTSKTLFSFMATPSVQSGQLEAILATSDFDGALDALCSATDMSKPTAPSPQARNAKEVEVAAII